MKRELKIDRAKPVPQPQQKQQAKPPKPALPKVRLSVGRRIDRAAQQQAKPEPSRPRFRTANIRTGKGY